MNKRRDFAKAATNISENPAKLRRFFLHDISSKNKKQHFWQMLLNFSETDLFFCC